MPSAQSAAISEYYRRSNAIAVQDPPLPLPELRDRDEHWGDLTAEPGGVDYLEVDAGGVRALWAVPHGCAADRVVLCLHGGGFIGGSIYTHRKLYGHLGKATGLRTLSVNYRRTPEHRYPAPHDDAAAAYRWLFEKEGSPPAAWPWRATRPAVAWPWRQRCEPAPKDGPNRPRWH